MFEQCIFCGHPIKTVFKMSVQGSFCPDCNHKLLAADRINLYKFEKKWLRDNPPSELEKLDTSKAATIEEV